MTRTRNDKYLGASPASPGPAVIPIQTRRRAYSVHEFCAAFRISRAFLYALWANGSGPAAMRIGRRTLISVEAANAWRLSLECAPHRDAEGGAQ